MSPTIQFTRVSIATETFGIGGVADIASSNKMEIGKDEFGSKEIGDYSESELHDVGMDEYGFGSTAVTVNDNGSFHDQLPSVEEYKTSQQVGQSRTGNATLFIRVAIMISVASILIAVGVVIGRDSEPIQNNDTAASMPFIPDHPEPVPENNEQGRQQDVATFLVNMGWASRGDIETIGSPQRKAAQWLADEDPMKLTIEVSAKFMNRYVMSTIYFALAGETWSYNLHFLSEAEVCDWNTRLDTGKYVEVEVGISCRDGETIEEIFLPNMGLQGKLPPELGLLYDLKDLNLFDNNIAGELPETMKHLVNIETLVLHNNKLEGHFPSWISKLTRLQTLNVASNNFYGPLPSGIGQSLTSLRTLSLEKNDFTSALTPLKGLPALDALYLGDNEFIKDLTDDVFNSWRKITILDISNNKLEGDLPSMILASDTLVVVDLHGNQFAGRLPTTIEVDAPLQFLALHDNQVTGPIDERMKGLSRLVHLDLSKNLFTGAMPAFLGNTKSLKYLFLAFNDLFKPGPIPVEYADLSNLVDLSLQETNRNGTIPFQFEILENLVLLDLNKNQLTGLIPEEIGGMKSLKFLLLQHNNLRGSLPSGFSHLNQLDTLVIDGNTFSGGWNHVCQTTLPLLTTFVATCIVDDCECCSQCCSRNDPLCRVEWFSDVDPIAEGGYVRGKYDFNEDDIEYPVQNQTATYYSNYSGYYKTPP